MERLPAEVLENILSYLHCWHTVQFPRVSKTFLRRIRHRRFFQTAKLEHDKLYPLRSTEAQPHPYRRACSDDYYDKVIEYGVRLGEIVVMMIASYGYYRGFNALIRKIRLSYFTWSSISYRACKVGDAYLALMAVELGNVNVDESIERAQRHDQHHVVKYLKIIQQEVNQKNYITP